MVCMEEWSNILLQVRLTILDIKERGLVLLFSLIRLYFILIKDMILNENCLHWLCDKYVYLVEAIH